MTVIRVDDALWAALYAEINGLCCRKFCPQRHPLILDHVRSMGCYAFLQRTLGKHTRD